MSQLADRYEDRYDFEPIPEVNSGLVFLQIYKPGTFFGRDQHAVFVGGCGVGHRGSLKDAKALLLQCAKQYCQRRIDEAERVVAHYKEQRAKLETRGLGPTKVAEARMRARRLAKR